MNVSVYHKAVVLESHFSLYGTQWILSLSTLFPGFPTFLYIADRIYSSMQRWGMPFTNFTTPICYKVHWISSSVIAVSLMMSCRVKFSSLWARI